MSNETNYTCQGAFPWYQNASVFEFEQGTIIHHTGFESAFWTIFTLTWSSLGIGFTTAALALLILTAVLFKEWRKSYKNQLLIQFMLARFLYTAVRFFGDVQIVFNSCPFSPAPNTEIVLKIYSEIALVVWMFVFTRQMYVSFVKVFVTENYNIWRVSVFAWSVPAVVALLLHLIFYVSKDTDSRYFILYLTLIKWPVLITNAVLLILVLRSILMNNKRTKNNVRIIVTMAMMIFMFCFQQILIDIGRIIFIVVIDQIYLLSKILIFSNIAAMFHCAFSIVFWVLGNANTRQLWKGQGVDLRTKIRISVRLSINI